MIQAKITEIGSEAINKEEPMLILFDKTATAALRKYSVIQEVSKDEPFSLKAGGTIAFDDQVYTIDYVGPMANGNLETVAHVSLIFDACPEEGQIANGIYLHPHRLPAIGLGSQIFYN
ncbi:TPA: PTS glucitol/sorbitol transporter subunit IIA [Enterococcus faecium]|uniref:PTS glucitol/sorbitol transporter subunit IIA n=1 Tax=Enterococcus TaxID=1350 RepID=UPI000CF04A72|nr:PTS glucitol/sorbitol transporter subunit IIA [Enterococcus faecium]EGP4918759.1 PTS glucitol/sorbitol transporter subunit IIA [Enterococcus faecium]EME8163939.1 PTS glucitol/sorbitol transporter subunit IIA [Enterococcus faecium]MBD9739163.1 PTS glucitol/sorbitol transporter subunit IIA [Enterococcus faecium]MBD9742638.1 PTS glucitol/sorbitol transporter subunit IIA [Enterococcus faecium]MBD9753687.1 PTS glucitol/sorbitol transporter subunit IIA [Enterococcus faecium]